MNVKVILLKLVATANVRHYTLMKPVEPDLYGYVLRLRVSVFLVASYDSMSVFSLDVELCSGCNSFQFHFAKERAQCTNRHFAIAFVMSRN